MSSEEEQIQISKNQYTLQALKEKLGQTDPKRAVTHLKLHLNYKASILKQISSLHSCLSHVQFLNLSFNNIDSLDPLQKFNFQHLKELHLFHNCITSLRPLRKCSMPNLHMVSLVNNKIRELSCVSEWNCPKLRQFFAYDNNMEYTVNAIIKMNCNQIRHILMDEEAVEKQQYAQYCYYFRFQYYVIS